MIFYENVVVLTLAVFIFQQARCYNALRSPTTLANPAPTPDDLLNELKLLKTEISSYASDKNLEFVIDFTLYLLKAQSKRERVCLANRFADYFTDVAQYLIKGFNDTEHDRVDDVVDEILSSSTAEIQTLIQEVADVKNSVADHKNTWPLYIEPISQANMKKYQACLE